jgi:lipopolysaccharide/colanic/teichoic acid biosynthesis glycosyltransferase
MYIKFKLAVDFIVALVLILLMSPVLLICFIIIKLEDPAGPVIFKQPRVGLNNVIFTVYKLRTMKEECNLNGESFTDGQRMLKSGTLFRKLSLDEIPQLFNILLGNMSFIGPRPLTVPYLDYYTSNELKRHNVKPGITGLAQVNGRNHLGWDERFKFDLFYVDNVGLKLDLKILILTGMKVAQGSDVAVRGENGLEDFHVYRINQLKEKNKNV